MRWRETAIFFQIHLSSYAEPCQLSTPRIITASLSLILFVWRPVSLFMFFYFFFYFCSLSVCVCVLVDSSGGEVAVTFIKAEAEWNMDVQGVN